MGPGTFVRHRLRPEWGVGRVESEGADDRISIRFNHGSITLKRSIAEPNLVEADAAEVQLSRLRASGQQGAAPIAKCQHCGKALNRSQYARGRQLKSCPRCSTENGSYHVFHDYPAAFGNSDARVSDETPDGAQSYCIACRNPSVGSTSPGRPCPSV